MKYACLGYYEEKSFEALPKAEQDRLVDACFTKEVLGGILVLETDDLDHAVQIMSKHPGLAFGFFEIRPLDEAITARAKARP